MTRTPSPPLQEVNIKKKPKLQKTGELGEFHKTDSCVDEKQFSIVIFSITKDTKMYLVEVLHNKNKVQVVDTASQLYKGTYDEMETGQPMAGLLHFPESHIISIPKNFTGVTRLLREIFEKFAVCPCYPHKTCWSQGLQRSAQNVDYIGEGSFVFSGKRVNLSETPPSCLKNCKIAGTGSLMKTERKMKQKDLEYSAFMLKKLEGLEHASEEKSFNIFLSKESGEGEEVFKNIDSDDMQPAILGTKKDRGDNRCLEMAVLRRTSNDWLILLTSVSPGEGIKIIEKIHLEKPRGTEPTLGIPVRGQGDSVYPPALQLPESHNRGKEHDLGLGFDFIGIDIDPKRKKSDQKLDWPFHEKGNHDLKVLRRSVHSGDADLRGGSVHPGDADLRGGTVHHGDAILETKGAACLDRFLEGLPADNPVSLSQPVSEELSGPSPECPSGAVVGDLSSAGVDGSPGVGNTAPSGAGTEGLSGQADGTSSSPEEFSSVAVDGFLTESVGDACSLRMSAVKDNGITLSRQNAVDERTEGHGEHMESCIQRTPEDGTVSKQLTDHEALTEHGTVESHNLNLRDGALPDLETDSDLAFAQHSSSHTDQPIATEARHSVTSIFRRPVQVSSPSNSQHVDHAYPEQCELEQDSHDLSAAQCEGSGRRPGGSIPPSGMPHRESHERSERWGSRPVSAHEQLHFIAQPIAEGMPYTTQETISFSFSPQEPFHDPGRSPVTVHAAGSMPSWAATEARIDLGVAANRSQVQLRTRLWTYGSDWEGTSSDNDPANMALAGFYRPDNRGRRVRCFYCGLERDIASHHNIWDEHVRYRPTCAYLRAIVGSDFIAEAQARLARGSGK